MILNCSGRTDIVAFYSNWFLKRVEEGYVDVRNPYYPKQVSRIPLDNKNIDAIVFVTKNPIPIIPNLEKLNDFPLLFQITITPYGKEIEPYVPSKRQIVQSVKQLSNKLGKEQVIVRYDPIFFSKKYSVEYHIKAFEKLCSEVSNYISTIIISFLDLKKNTINHYSTLQNIPFTKENIDILCYAFSRIANSYQIKLQTCCEEIDLSRYHITNTSCVNQTTIDLITGYHKHYRKNKNRNGCHCLETVDIGVYNSCPHFCKYCYANFLESEVLKNCKKHDNNSSFLIGNSEEDDILKLRVESDDCQMTLPI